ncbi:MAG: ABC transporter permease [Alphaproteobacteria bacterium]|nr:ABC transporter permease [Alphaproteobacteria bacterium]
MLRRFFILLFFLSLWQGLCSIGRIPPYILPNPTAVFLCLCQKFDLIGWHALISLSEMLMGFSIALIGGIGTALALDRFHKLCPWIYPFLIVIQSTPSFVLMPILLIWIGFGILPKIIVVALSCYFPITTCLWDGLKRTPQGWLNMAASMQGRHGKTLRYIRLPAALPALLSGIRIASIHAPLTVVAAEWMGASSGLGYLIMVSHGRLQIDLLFACIIVLISITFTIQKMVLFLERKIIFWPIQG